MEAVTKRFGMDSEQTRIDLDKLKVGAAICANKKCPKYDPKAVMYLYPSSVYCSLKCKYDDADPTHKETYGD